MVKSESSSGEYGSEIESVKYVDLDADGKEEAVIVITTSQEVAGAYWEQDYFVFTYRDSKPVQVFHEYRYKAGGIRFAGKALIIEAPFWKEDDGHCCPSSTETTIYRWSGDGLVRASRTLKRMR